VSATRLADSEGKITGAIESLRDVTHQKRIERELRESNTYLDTVINTLADPLFIKDRSYRFVRLNNSFCRFTGHSREEMLGKTDFDFFSREEAEVFRKNDDEVFGTGQINENEETITDASGTFHTIVTKKALYTNTAGEKFIVGIIRDITDRKKTEYALQQALKKLNMLSSITRHDILNQLMGLRTYLALMEGDEKDPAILGFLKTRIVRRMRSRGRSSLPGTMRISGCRPPAGRRRQRSFRRRHPRSCSMRSMWKAGWKGSRCMPIHSSEGLLQSYRELAAPRGPCDPDGAWAQETRYRGACHYLPGQRHGHQPGG